jgi:hypothetical protein
MKIWIYAASLFLGALMGTTLFRTVGDLSGSRTSAADTADAVRIKSARGPEPVGVRIGRMIAAETTAMNENVPINDAVGIFFSEKKSPLRTRAFLKSRIQTMTRDQLRQALMSGEIQTESEIRETARRLTNEDPDGTFKDLNSQSYKLSGMDNLYAFIDTMLQTSADADAPAMMRRLQQMKRGGSQQDQSLRFSNYWASVDPAAAARNFNDLVYLRNMADQGAMVFTDKTFAENIVASWKRKDEKAMRAYIWDMPPGRERDAFESALKKHDAPK